MSKDDIVITLFTIVYGLMLTDLFLSLHKLIRNKNVVKWHWLPLLSSWYLFLIILKNWWDLAFFQNTAGWMNIYFFIVYGHLLVLIFLTVSSALPDKVTQDGIDLKEYYFSNNAYFWGLMSSVVFTSLAIGIFKQLVILDSINISNILGNCILIFLLITLAATKKYWIHSTIVSLIIILVILEIVIKNI